MSASAPRRRSWRKARIASGGRSTNSPADSGLPYGALSDLSRSLVADRGQADPVALAGIFVAGYTPAQALEVVLGVAVSVLPNFAHSLTGEGSTMSSGRRSGRR